MGAKSQWPNAMPWGAKRASTPCAGKTGAKRRHQLLEPSKARDARLEGCRERAVWQNGECGAVRIAQLRRIVRRHGAQRAVHSAIRGALAHVDRGGVQDAARRPIHPPAARPTGTGLTDSTSCANASHAAPCRCQQESRPSAQTQPENLHSLRPVRLPRRPKPLQALVPGPHRPAAARALHAGRPVLANCALGSFRLSAPCTRRLCAATQCSVQPPRSSLPARARAEGGFMSNVTTGAL